MSERTNKALLARGIDAQTAEKLVSLGHTLKELQQKSDLSSLGLSDDQISKIQNGSRPPIPTHTLNTLLHKSAYTCCVCRKKEYSIIIHHIKEWSQSHSHDEHNLVVLCLNCHSRAHSRSTIATNLTPDKLHHSKNEWEKTVRKSESDSLYTKSSWGTMDGMWDYFNHQRILDVTHSLHIAPSSVEGYDALLKEGVIDTSGGYVWPVDAQNNTRFMYDGFTPPFNRLLAKYYSQLTRTILEKVDWLDVTTIFKKSTANRIKENMVISVTGAHRFKRFNENVYGRGQTRSGYKQGHGLKVVFSIDAWEATSVSSWDVHLSDNWRCSSVLLVRSLERTKSVATVHCTCLAIGTGFTDHVAAIPAIAYRNEYDDSLA